jgi:hypothetical protein
VRAVAPWAFRFASDSRYRSAFLTNVTFRFPPARQTDGFREQFLIDRLLFVGQVGVVRSPGRELCPAGCHTEM